MLDISAKSFDDKPTSNLRCLIQFVSDGLKFLLVRSFLKMLCKYFNVSHTETNNYPLKSVNALFTLIFYDIIRIIKKIYGY